MINFTIKLVFGIRQTSCIEFDGRHRINCASGTFTSCAIKCHMCVFLIHKLSLVCRKSRKWPAPTDDFSRMVCTAIVAALIYANSNRFVWTKMTPKLLTLTLMRLPSPFNFYFNFFGYDSSLHQFSLYFTITYAHSSPPFWIQAEASTKSSGSINFQFNCTNSAFSEYAKLCWWFSFPFVIGVVYASAMEWKWIRNKKQ